MIDLKCVALSLFAILPLFGYAQQNRKVAVLPRHEANAIPKLFLRPMTGRITGTWQPTKSDYDSVEANLSRISTMPLPGWPAVLRIEHPEQDFRQYVPVILSGEKVIFINAFCNEVQPLPYWHVRVVQYFDGATCFWRAFFNPATREFTQLDINARA